MGEANNNVLESQLILPSLGRVGFIGELYDARTESFSSQSLLDKSSSSNLIECQDIGRMEFDYKLTETFSDRFDLLQVRGDIQIGILLDLISVEGSGEFLKGEKNTEKSVSSSLVCNTYTTCEKIFASSGEILRYFDLNILENTESTHLITAVNWGAKCLLSLTVECKDDTRKEELGGQLNAQMEKLANFLSAKGSAGLEKKNCDMQGFQNMQIKVSADLVPDGSWPVSIQSFCEFVEGMPNLLKKVNNGKGKPMSYVMTPLNYYRKLAKIETAIDTTVRMIDETFVYSTVLFLEEIALIKRKLNDLVEEMSRMEKYVLGDELKKAREHKNKLILKESAFKRLVSENWRLVKSGNKSLQELIKQIEEFKGNDLKLSYYEEYLESTAVVLKKIQFVNLVTSKGVLYLGRGDDFNFHLTKNSTCEFLILLMSSRTKENDENLFYSTIHYFFENATSRKPNTEYLIIDFDYQKDHSFMNQQISNTKCVHTKGSQILCWDMYAEFIAEKCTNFARLSGSQAEYNRHKPGNRVPLKMLCPNFGSGICSNNVLEWTCFRCKAPIEYGFDNFFYCSCGMSRVDEFEYRCSDHRHGHNFVKGDRVFIEKQLSFLRPVEDLNILLMGQSGVGKSTCVNSFINYLSYETLDEAKTQGIRYIIPMNITMHDPKTYEEFTIKIGEDHPNEVTAIGHSSTQFPQTYTFLWKNKNVRIIDTPGLGDTDGISKDKFHMKNIINHIGYLKELHAVCIILKANEHKIHAIFAYCLKELFCHLHKSIAKNIIFCFTNARNSFYTPGKSSVLLGSIISKLEADKDLPLGRHNMFCVDNEAFLFLCSLNSPQSFYDENLVDSFQKSWKISLEETKRMFETITSFKPHKLVETVSLANVRYRIQNLSKPIGEISKTIQLNLNLIEKKKQELQASNQTLEELSKKLTVTEIHLEPENLDYPRTVCTSPSCVKYIKLLNVDFQDIEYKTICHKHCYLENVEAATINNSKIRNCDAMAKNGVCGVCGCSWQKHMHITYIQHRVEKKVVNKVVEGSILEEKSVKEDIEKVVRFYEQQTAKYTEEQKFIIEVSAKFGLFLQQNAISVFNDKIEDYIQYLIEQEESKPHKSKSDKDLIESLKSMLLYYKAEVKVLQDVLQKAKNINEKLTVEEVLKLEKELYTLELTGNEIRKLVECSRASNKKAMEYSEIPVSINKNKGKDQYAFEQNRNQTSENKSFWKKGKEFFFNLI